MAKLCYHVFLAVATTGIHAIKRTLSDSKTLPSPYVTDENIPWLQTLVMSGDRLQIVATGSMLLSDAACSAKGELGFLAAPKRGSELDYRDPRLFKGVIPPRYEMRLFKNHQEELLRSTEGRFTYYDRQDTKHILRIFFDIPRSIGMHIAPQDQLSVTYRLISPHVGISSRKLHVYMGAQDHPQHWLGAMTTLNKNHNWYLGNDRNIKGPRPAHRLANWNSSESVERFRGWYGHYKKLGVQHFYIVDNDPHPHGNGLEEECSGKRDITYIQAPIAYDTITPCGSMGCVFAGQVVLENMIIQIAKSNWLISADIDEFMIPESPHTDFMTMIRKEETRICENHDINSCTDISKTAKKVYSLALVPQDVSFEEPSATQQAHMDQRASVGQSNLAALRSRMKVEAGNPGKRKNILRPGLTAELTVHYPVPKDRAHSFESTVPVQDGWFAHFHGEDFKRLSQVIQTTGI